MIEHFLIVGEDDPGRSLWQDGPTTRPPAATWSAACGEDDARHFVINGTPTCPACLTVMRLDPDQRFREYAGPESRS
jgi:hypothetical protein